MNRNKKPKFENKTKRIEIRCTEKEYSLFQEKTKGANYKQVSDFIRDRCLFDSQIILDTSDFAKMLVKLHVDMSGVSNNINQLVKAINIDIKSNGYMTEQNFDKAIEYIMLYNSILRVLDKELRKLLRHTSRRKLI